MLTDCSLSLVQVEIELLGIIVQYKIIGLHVTSVTGILSRPLQLRLQLLHNMGVKLTYLEDCIGNRQVLW